MTKRTVPFLFFVAVFGMSLLSVPDISGTEANAECEPSPMNEPTKNYEVYDGYFVRNTFKPEEGKDYAVGVLTSEDDFGKIFGIARVMWSRQKFIPEDFYRTGMILYFIEWGSTPWEYHVFLVEKSEKTAIVSLTRTGEPSETALFAPSLIVGVDREEFEGIESVQFRIMKSPISSEAPIIFSADLK